MVRIVIICGRFVYGVDKGCGVVLGGRSSSHPPARCVVGDSPTPRPTPVAEGQRPSALPRAGPVPLGRCSSSHPPARCVVGDSPTPRPTPVAEGQRPSALPRAGPVPLGRCNSSRPPARCVCGGHPHSAAYARGRGATPLCTPQVDPTPFDSPSPRAKACCLRRNDGEGAREGRFANRPYSRRGCAPERGAGHPQGIAPTPSIAPLPHYGGGRSRYVGSCGRTWVSVGRIPPFTSGREALKWSNIGSLRVGTAHSRAFSGRRCWR